MLIEFEDECPCCNKHIVFKIDIVPYSDPTKSICPECNGVIYTNEQWICDPECESDGEYIYRVYNFEDYCDIFGVLVINMSLLNELYNGRIVSFEMKKDNTVDILQARIGQSYLFTKTVEEIIKLKEEKGL